MHYTVENKSSFSTDRLNVRSIEGINESSSHPVPSSVVIFPTRTEFNAAFALARKSAVKNSAHLAAASVGKSSWGMCPTLRMELNEARMSAHQS